MDASSSLSIAMPGMPVTSVDYFMGVDLDEIRTCLTDAQRRVAASSADNLLQDNTSYAILQSFLGLLSETLTPTQANTLRKAVSAGPDAADKILKELTSLKPIVKTRTTLLPMEYEQLVRTNNFVGLIVGPPKSGKTTLLSFLKAMLPRIRSWTPQGREGSRLNVAAFYDETDTIPKHGLSQSFVDTAICTRVDNLGDKSDIVAAATHVFVFGRPYYNSSALNGLLGTFTDRNTLDNLKPYEFVVFDKGANTFHKGIGNTDELHSAKAINWLEQGIVTNIYATKNVNPLLYDITLTSLYNDGVTVTWSDADTKKLCVLELSACVCGQLCSPTTSLMPSDSAPKRDNLRGRMVPVFPKVNLTLDKSGDDQGAKETDRPRMVKMQQHDKHRNMLQAGGIKMINVFDAFDNDKSVTLFPLDEKDVAVTEVYTRREVEELMRRLNLFDDYYKPTMSAYYPSTKFRRNVNASWVFPSIDIYSELASPHPIKSLHVSRDEHRYLLRQGHVRVVGLNPTKDGYAVFLETITGTVAWCDYPVEDVRRLWADLKLATRIHPMYGVQQQCRAELHLDTTIEYNGVRYCVFPALKDGDDTSGGAGIEGNVDMKERQAILGHDGHRMMLNAGTVEMIKVSNVIREPEQCNGFSVMMFPFHKDLPVTEVYTRPHLDELLKRLRVFNEHDKPAVSVYYPPPNFFRTGTYGGVLVRVFPPIDIYVDLRVTLGVHSNVGSLLNREIVTKLYTEPAEGDTFVVLATAYTGEKAVETYSASKLYELLWALNVADDHQLHGTFLPTPPYCMTCVDVHPNSTVFLAPKFCVKPLVRTADIEKLCNTLSTYVYPAKNAVYANAAEARTAIQQGKSEAIVHNKRVFLPTSYLRVPITHSMFMDCQIVHFSRRCTFIFENQHHRSAYVSSVLPLAAISNVGDLTMYMMVDGPTHGSKTQVSNVFLHENHPMKLTGSQIAELPEWVCTSKKRVMSCPKTCGCHTE